METDDILFDALEFAVKAHRGQVRKGTRLPYVFHPMNVARTLLESGYDDDIVIAGLLHDTIEDTDTTIEEIESVFGAQVASLVLGASEKNKDDTWEKRKEETIEHLKSAPIDLLLVSCADKLDNIRSIRTDLESLGEAVWNRFKRSRKSQEWYYKSLLGVFSERFKGTPHSRLAELLSSEVKIVFGTP
jgi:(p)ppGpp synthase/HD superfamily hydrolase